MITLKTKGVIEKNKFQVTSQYVPMIGNEVTLTTKEELDLIFGLELGEDSVYIGKSLLEGQPINIPINKFLHLILASLEILVVGSPTHCTSYIWNCLEVNIKTQF